ncbi:helix-turn-helix domain-containing protein [Flavobacterium cupreum]|nr:helix-turn-helix domain-containing protein [Flavobacterium cupreum]
MSAKKEAIEVHKDELGSIGVDLATFDNLNEYLHVAHRDNHYMFIIQQTGYFLWELDFNEINQTGPSVSFVAPGQMHRYLDVKECSGWLVFVDNELVPVQYREIFTSCLNLKQVAAVDHDEAAFKILPLLVEMLKEESQPLYKSVIRSMIETLAGIMATRILLSQNLMPYIGGTKYNTVVTFKQLVGEKIKESKQVQEYASLLNISPLYLNEIVKQITGFPASYWINQEILLEAKRMLYYTTLDVKQIAYELGYEDHAYFSRFFKKNTAMTALEFRNLKPLII